jgi:xylulose-5-phosphate/fructose-6-phosphate phosphoketolase
MRRLFRQFSFPGGIPGHCSAQTPGAIQEGGELGYSLAHAYGAALDNPGLIVACVIGDGEAETGPLAASWHAGKFLDPARDGVVLPILHLNGYRTAGPALLARIPEDELVSLLEGYGHRPYIVSGDDPAEAHQAMATTLDAVLDEITQNRLGGGRTKAPMLVLRTPKGWTGPRELDGRPVEGGWRSHRVPLPHVRDDPAELELLAEWLRSYRPGELFEQNGRPVALIRSLVPYGTRRMGASPHANGGLLMCPLGLPDIGEYAVELKSPATIRTEPTGVLAPYLRDVVQANRDTFRLMDPDETVAARLPAVFEVTDRAWDADRLPTDEHLSRGGRVMDVLSEHLCQGWLEGYLLTGRHGLLTCDEAFAHIVTGMVGQHAKWLGACGSVPWRRPIASLTYLLTLDGRHHPDPGFLDMVANKRAPVIRVYLPPDANTLVATTDLCLRSRSRVNVIVAGGEPTLDLFSAGEATAHCSRGLGILPWASTDQGDDPDVVLACAGGSATLETLAAADLLRHHFPALKLRVINVVDLMRLQPQSEHPVGLPDTEFDALFTVDKPIIFAFHGYPWLIHRLAYRRAGHAQMHVRGYKEEGGLTTPFDLAMRNDLDRYRLAMDVIDRVPSLRGKVATVRQQLADERLAKRVHAREHGDDHPDILDWTWPWPAE